MENYLNKIKNREHVSYQSFLNKCSKYNIKDAHLRQVFYVKSCLCNRKNQYMLTIKDQKLFDTTFSRFFSIGNDIKVTAALRGNSKSAKSEKAILIWKEHFNSINSIGIEFNKKEYILDINKKNTLVIIENLNNFLNIETNFESSFDLDKCNFVWGSGNGITNNYFQDFINEYDNVICFFDIDLGGLKFYKSLLTQLNKKPTFYFTEKIKKQIISYGKTITHKDYEKLMKLYANIEELKEVVDFIQKHKKFAEQEIFQQQR